MGQALYRQYRPKSLSEVVGQEHVTTTLTNALKSGRVSHAYLLSGPRGVGKTSIARILAHEINGLAYDEQAHLDIIEIDAASNRRIDEIRDLRERVHTAPASATYKVYIIDEVHMLTKEAFNALLKTLEEPPAHVVFILATTEAHRLPETIISRTQHYTLHPIPQEKVTNHLKSIVKSESMKVDDDALGLIAQYGEGSFRDSISLLDQARSMQDHLTRANIEHMVGLAPEAYLTRLSEAIAANIKNDIVVTLSDLYTQGFEPAMIAQQLGVRIRAAVIADKAANPIADLELLKRLLDVPSARAPRQLLEIILLQATLPSNPTANQAIERTLTTPTSSVSAEREATQSLQDLPSSNTSTEADEILTEATDTANPVDKKDVTELWQQALEAIKKQYNTLYGIARMAQPEFDGKRLSLAFKFAFHQKRLSEARNRKVLTEVVERLYGQPVEIICVTAAKPHRVSKPNMATIHNVFGNTEPLES